MCRMAKQEVTKVVSLVIMAESVFIPLKMSEYFG